jgi:hypothetical protein
MLDNQSNTRRMMKNFAPCTQNVGKKTDNKSRVSQGEFEQPNCFLLFSLVFGAWEAILMP